MDAAFVQFWRNVACLTSIMSRGGLGLGPLLLVFVCSHRAPATPPNPPPPPHPPDEKNSFARESLKRLLCPRAVPCGVPRSTAWR